ncbi:hypothetical protein BGZ60DRAFT_419026 [Tricladium varicosporioides]|nr:hypothetical protein BGZ60DRAFT_419026 [Hymenoscyphus varicosporioides]
MCYRKAAFGQQKVQLEWIILWRDIELDPLVRTRFSQYLLFIALNLLDKYDTRAALTLLKKDEDEFLQPFRTHYMDISACLLKRPIANFKAKAKLNFWQHMIDLQYTANYNANICGSFVGISGSKPFGVFNSQEMLDALSKSPLFPAETLYKLDIVKLSAQIMAKLPIGYPDGYLDIPFEVLSKLGCAQVNMISVQIAHFYREHPSLQIQTNNVLVLLAWSSNEPVVNRFLVEWAVSGSGLGVYERVIKDIQECQKTEQLVLALAALLCYQRLFPVTHNDQPIKGSYQADFNAILNGERLGNEPTVLEHMGFSVLRACGTVKDNEKMRLFLAAVLCIEPPVPGPFHEFSDQYWKCRMEVGLAHHDAFKMAEFEYLTEKIEGWTTISGEEMGILDNEKGQGEGMVVQALGVTSTDGGWLLVETQWKEDPFANPGAHDAEDRLRPFPKDIFHLDAYRLVCVCLPKVAPHENILSTISLPNGSLAMIVLRSYIPELERNLNIECFQYSIEPGREDVELLGSVEARNQKIDMLARLAVDAILRDSTLEKGLWIYADPLCILRLLSIWLSSQPKRDSPAFLELTGIGNNVEAGQILLDGYDFNSFTLVRVSNFGRRVQLLKKLAKFDEILSIEELQGGSWELLVRKSYLPRLKGELGKVVPDCNIEPGYDPTEPSAKEVEEFGYRAAKILKTTMFHDRVERIKREPWPRTRAFYSELGMRGGREGATGDEGEMAILDDGEGNREEELAVVVEA